MARPNYAFSKGSQEMLQLLSRMRLGEPLPSEVRLASILDVSRGTLRSILQRMQDIGYIAMEGANKVVKRCPTSDEVSKAGQPLRASQLIEREFLDRIGRGELKKDQRISELQLAKDIGVGTAVVREFLIGFSQSGLVEKLPRGGWVLKPLDAQFVRELAQMRRLLELEAFDCMAARGFDDGERTQVRSLIDRHQMISGSIDDLFAEFPKLDRELHQWLLDHMRNRFASEFMSNISIIFHFHYQVRRNLEKPLNIVAIEEHLKFLQALEKSDFPAARRLLLAHLDTSVTSLISSLSGSGP
jgi:DNA-binding GntR family transcriptional regulator